MTDTLVTDNFYWVEAMKSEREARGMTQADLAHASHCTPTAINDYEKLKRPHPDANLLARVSVALGHAPDWLPRLAGILPPEPDTDETLDQIHHLYTTLRTEVSKSQALEYMRFLKTQEERAEYNAHPKRKTPNKKK